jgi:hypothetical protein
VAAFASKRSRQKNEFFFQLSSLVAARTFRVVKVAVAFVRRVALSAARVDSHHHVSSGAYE